MEKGKNILICPLDWGLGHAGRMVTIARKLQQMNNKIFIGAAESQTSFFKNALSDVVIIRFPGFKPHYSSFLPQYLALIPQIPRLACNILKEHVRLKKLIRNHNIDIVISDNRFGLWNKGIKSVYVTHQLRIPFPAALRIFEPAGTFLHRKIIEKYSICLIPDLPGEINVSGRLSHGVVLPANTMYAGLFSRFSDTDICDETKRGFSPHTTVILSGPEPQRSLLKRQIEKVAPGEEHLTIILEGNPEGRYSKQSGNIMYHSHLPDEQMKKIITSGTTVIARAGYSTIMELISLGTSAILVPTPGQTEQEYLAAYLCEKGLFDTVSQKKLTPSVLRRETVSAAIPGYLAEESRRLLDDALKEILR